MKNLVINLDRSPDRLKHCHEQFGRLNLDFERVAAVDARDLSQSELDNIVLHKDWPKPTNSEFACFMSHRKCWEILVAGTDEYAAIFEDDIILSDSAAEFLKNSDWVPGDVNILRLETFKTKVYFKRWWRLQIRDRHLLKMVGFHAGAGGYIISRRLAVSLLKETVNYMPAPVDHYLFDPGCEVFANNIIFQLVPAVCAQEQVLSAGTLTLGGNIEDRSVVNLIQKKRGSLSGGQKMLRELKRGVYKLKRLAVDKRMIVDVQ